MATTPLLQRFVDDELNRAGPMAERIHAGALQLLRDVPAPGMARLEIDLNFEAAEALQRRAAAFRDGFVAALRERVQGNAARVPTDAGIGDGLALLDESQVQVDIEISRAMQLIDATAEWELRELSTFTSTLAGLDHVSAASNPLGPAAHAGALWDATETLGHSVPLRAAVLRVASGVLAGLLRTACAAASSRLEAQGIVPGAYRTVVMASGTVPKRERVDVTQPGALHGLLAQMTPAATQPAPRDGVDARIVELLARLFEAIQSDPDLSPGARAPIARLQAAAMRVALQDRSMLDAHDHPVWRLMDRIAATMATHPQSDGPRTKPVLEACEAAVDEVVRADTPTTTDFRRAIAVLDARLATNFDTERAAAQGAVDALERRERREYLTQQFASRLAEQAAPVRMSADLRRFVTGTWAMVLAESWLRFGEPAGESQEAVRTVDDLLWSLQPREHPQSRQRLLALLPSLLQRLRAGMALIELPAPEQNAMLDELMAVHTAALKPRGQSQEAALTPQQIVQQMRDEMVPEATPGRPFVDSVIDIGSMDTVPLDFLPTRPGEPAVAPARRLDTLRPGERLRLFVHGGWSRVQLLWRGERARHFLFAGEVPGSTHPFTRRALERLAEAGLVQPLEDHPLVQRAVDLLLRRFTLPT